MLCQVLGQSVSGCLIKDNNRCSMHKDDKQGWQKLSFGIGLLWPIMKSKDFKLCPIFHMEPHQILKNTTWIIVVHNDITV